MFHRCLLLLLRLFQPVLTSIFEYAGYPFSTKWNCGLVDSIDVQSGLLSGELFARFTPSVQGGGVGIEWKLNQSTVNEYRHIAMFRLFNRSCLFIVDR